METPRIEYMRDMIEQKLYVNQCSGATNLQSVSPSFLR
jgi:hypothetical protein